MFPEYVEKTVKDVKELKIQGARNIARELVKVFIRYVEEENFKSREEMEEKVIKLGLYLMDSRPTEPMTRNFLKEIINLLINISTKQKDVENTKKYFGKIGERVVELFYKSIEDISIIGASLIEDGSSIITHCHSSTVTSILKKAKDMGKEFTVFSSETRPKYQGRITAKELSYYGIDVKFYVDSAMSRFARKADIAIVGGDAITAEGDLINKIGTLNLGIIMNYYGKELYSAVELYKFNPETILGMREEIEKRDPKEVWEDPPKGVEVLNYAFDVVPSKLIKAYITNKGIVAPVNIKEEFEKFREEVFRF